METFDSFWLFEFAFLHLLYYTPSSILLFHENLYSVGMSDIASPVLLSVCLFFAFDDQRYT